MIARAVALSLGAFVFCACDGVFGLQTVHSDDTDATGAHDIKVETIGHAHDKETRALQFPVVGVAGKSNQLLVVFAAIGSYCNDLSVPNAIVVYAGAAPTPFHSRTGTPCEGTLSHSYMWLFPDPPAGVNEVLISLDAQAHSLHGGALLLSGVDTNAAVRTVASGSGKAVASSVDVASDVGDFVVSFVAQGTNIVDPGTGNTLRYLDNVDDATTLGNTGVSTIPGASPSVAAQWTFSVSDEWHAIAVSLRPAP